MELRVQLHGVKGDPGVHTGFGGVIVLFVVVVRKMEQELITILDSKTQTPKRKNLFAVNQTI